jgi:phosphatidylinositol alpha-1,6-mannosyltransferase
VVKEFPSVRYLLAGLPTRKKELNELAIALGVQSNVQFLGPVRNEDLLPLFNACDLFAMTSRNMPDGDFEGYGIAVIEAALCGKPSVVSSGSGLVEAIQDGITGIAVPQNDSSRTAAAILSLLRDPAKRQRMGTAAWERALAEQTWERRAILYDHFLRQLTGHSETIETPNIAESFPDVRSRSVS